jgi:hypothetical protein
MPFMPMLLMDSMKLLYEDYIEPLSLQHQEKYLRKRWYEAYKHYIKHEFEAFNDVQKAEICDLMNDLDEYIHNDLETLRVTIMNHFMSYDFDTRLVVSTALTCNILAQSAQILWKATRMKFNTDINSVEVWSLKFLNEYADKRIDRSVKVTDLNQFIDVKNMVQQFCNRIIEFSDRL